MKTSLTLSLEQDVVRQASAYARQTGQELTELLAAYVEHLAHQRPLLPELPPDIQALRGSISLPPDTDYKALVAEEVARNQNA